MNIITGKVDSVGHTSTAVSDSKLQISGRRQEHGCRFKSGNRNYSSSRASSFPIDACSGVRRMSSLEESNPLRLDTTAPADQEVTKYSTRLALPSLTAAAIQAIGVFSMAANSVKVALGMGSVAAAGSSSFIHSTPVRIPLMIMAAIGATVTLCVVWNGWRLRNRPAAR